MSHNDEGFCENKQKSLRGDMIRAKLQAARPTGGFCILRLDLAS